MFSKKLTHELWTLALAATLSACSDASGSGDGNDTGSGTGATGSVSSTGGTTAAKPADSLVSLTVQGTQPSAALMLQAASGIDVFGRDGAAMGTIALTEARIVLEKIKLEGDDDGAATSVSESESAEAAEQEFKGPYVVDLLTNAMTPEPPALAVPQGLYKRVKLGVHKTEDGDAAALGLETGDPLIGNSIHVAGTYTPAGGQAKPFSMTFELSEEFELASVGGFDISTAGVNPFVIAFRLADWFRFDGATNSDGVSLNDVTADAITLDEDADEVAKKVRQVIKENIKTSAEMGKDEDGDGKLGDREDGDDKDDESEKAAAE